MKQKRCEVADILTDLFLHAPEQTEVDVKDMNWITPRELLSMVASSTGSNIWYRISSDFLEIEKDMETLRKVDKAWNYKEIKEDHK